jgi:CYTH domain-containing protein
MRRASGSRFACTEWERRFLLKGFPTGVPVIGVRQISDRYITGTRLRLRRTSHSNGDVEFKLTQKLNDDAAGARQGQLTTIYLKEEEYKVFEALPAWALEKTRHSMPPFGIDVFKGNLSGLILAEAEFSSAEEASALELPGFLFREVTSDCRFSGGFLSVVTRQRLVDDLQELGISLNLGCL